MSSNFEHILLFFKNNDFRGALDQLNKSDNGNKNNFTFYFYRGIANLKLNKFDEATLDFKKGLSINSNSAEIYNNLGILNYKIGNNELAIENFVDSIRLKNDFKNPISALVNVLTHTENFENLDSKIVSTHNQINKIDFNYSLDENIENDMIKKNLKDLNNIIDNNLKNLEINVTQIFRRDKPPLNCERHHKVFNSYEIIPKFCFSCFKVLIEIDNVIDLIKLFIIFDNIKFPNFNTKKCMIELRPNVSGKYKGLVYCNSREESESVLNQLTKICQRNLSKKLNYKIKKGCTEFAIKYPNYDTLKNDELKYNNDWKKYEDIIDENNPDLAFEKISRPTIKGISLSDVLVIRNWLCYAKLIGDNSYKTITDQTYNSKYVEKKLSIMKSYFN